MRQTSNIRCTLVGNDIVDRFDVFEVLRACQRSSNIFILNLTPGFKGLDKENCHGALWDMEQVHFSIYEIGLLQNTQFGIGISNLLNVTRPQWAENLATLFCYMGNIHAHPAAAISQNMPTIEELPYQPKKHPYLYIGCYWGSSITGPYNS